MISDLTKRDLFRESKSERAAVVEPNCR